MTQNEPKRAPRAGIRKDQMLAERTVAGMMAKDTFSQWLGIRIVDVRPRTATVTATIRADMLNGFGVAHGGVVYSVADSALAFASNTHGKVTMSIDNAISYPAPIQLGDVITAVAECERESNRLAFFRVTVRNQKDETVSLFRGTVYKTQDDHNA